jgi:WD40 repeat protein/tRNA A-37 threonylcarbamoyl transferase component Bud32
MHTEHAVDGLERPIESHCDECGVLLHAGQDRPVCVRCALVHALEPSLHGGPEVLTQQQSVLGDYELLEELGRGGMGVVYKARQKSLGRVVAIKMLLPGRSANEEFVTRFRGEASAAAALLHPNIVAIHEVGCEEGQHYFSMDYVAGRTLADIAREGPLPARRAAEYVRTLALAMQYAHRHGIMHRDLKPSNVLIDAGDQPHITDFGLAKEISAEVGLTVTGQVLGSPSYMPPEQADSRCGTAGPHSDVYGLGATLYHVLTGRPPFMGQDHAETLRQVLMADPVSIRLLNPAVPMDLETICLKCLEKEPARRYSSTQALAEDLRCFLHGEPILARPIGAAGRMRRWCRRNPLVATLVAAVATSMVLGFAGIAWQSGQQRRAAAEARVQRNEAQAQRDIAQGRLYAAQMRLAHAACLAGRTGGALELLRAQVPARGATDFRGFEWRYLDRLCQSGQSEVLGESPAGYQSVAFSSDAGRIAFGTSDGFVEIYDREHRARLARWAAHPGAVDSLAFYPRNDGWLVTTSGDDGVLKLWDVDAQQVVFATGGPKGMLVDFALSPSGTLWLTRAPDAQSAHLWEFRPPSRDGGPALVRRLSLPYRGPAAFSPDERVLAVANRADGVPAVALVDLTTGAATDLETAHADLVRCLAFSADGRRLASGGGDERVVLWDTERRAAIRTFDTDLVGVTSVAFDPAGGRLFASGWEQSIRSWPTMRTSGAQTWSGHGAGVNGLAVAADGAAMASAGRDGTARLWHLSRDVAAVPASSVLLLNMHTMRAPENDRPFVKVAASPDQQRIAAITVRTLTLLDLSTGQVLGRTTAAKSFGPDSPGFTTVAFAPDGRTIAVGGAGPVAFLDAGTLRPIGSPVNLHAAFIWSIGFGLDGKVLATSGALGTMVKMTDVASRRPWRDPIRGVEGSFPPQPMAVSPDGRRLATGSPEQLVRVWEISSGRLVASSPERVRFPHALAFSPDGDLVAYSDERGSVFLWDTAGLRPLRKLVVSDAPANTLAFSPDGRTLASGHMDHTIRLWHPDIAQEVAVLAGHAGWVWSLAFAEHGNALVSSSRDGTVRLWRATPSPAVPSPASHPRTSR